MDEHSLRERVKSALDRKCDAVDDDALSRLRQARADAVRAAHAESRWFSWFSAWKALPISVATAALVAAVGVAVWQNQVPTDSDMAFFEGSMVAMEMSAEDIDPELLEEIEFYEWLTWVESTGDSA